ncbi:hypothetical protein A1O7_00402 [Cladophialophora yegresii CBS 114405]|uniref:BRCT domain-containing protein n=1 Tax=Cladophialophora yegresii CBS 114405 TaxID=1182544 RepID=W9WHH1_9EURO|nr:uncharacterized protein A1O7_00402 [Cladophialophora yegresii CBS 114405]EXJ64066.1 hypothetical protein A1O7_00402 [Cladophialophora yegresii CBS 114405]
MAPSTSSHRIDLSSAPPVFVLQSHLQPEELHETEDLIYQSGGHITYDAKEARLFVGRVARKTRAAFDLRVQGVWTEDSALPEHGRNGNGNNHPPDEGPPKKKARLSSDHGAGPSTIHRQASSSTVSASPERSPQDAARSPEVIWPDLSNHIIVVKLAWLDACSKEGKLVPYKPYVVYTAKIVPRPDGETTPKTSPTHTTYAKVGSTTASQASSPSRSSRPDPSAILERARAEAASLPARRRRWGDHGHDSSSSQHHKAPKLHRTTTSEMEYIAAHPLPPLPDWATGPYAHYSCCRSTFLTTPNSAFISQLTKIKDARLLRLDDVGVRAYGTSIASISAYPHRIEHAEEITRLPGCEQKIASLWREWQDSAATDEERHIQEVQELDAEPDLNVLRLFWNIWGVGAETARRFYYDHGWRELDDIVEFGWQSLTRVQQIGLKYWDDFADKIPRAEVKAINDVILQHARRVLKIPEDKFGTKDDVECVIVGGYRRGKALCGDVDVVVSHRDESKTKDLVGEVVCSLEDAGYITHTLTLHTTTSDRGQATLPYRAQQHRGHGFDSLDKALCVWQDPVFDEGDRAAADDAGAGAGDKRESGSDHHEKASRKQKNPNIHRRVDIIISPWRTVGCAVLGWSGGTTFQRDIRRFVAKVHELKFDSSGVRNRGNGRVLDLEGPRPRLRLHNRPGPALSPTNDADEDTDKDNDKQKQIQVAREKEVIESLLQGTPIEKDDERWKGMEWDDADTWWDRERRLMEGLGIGYRPAEERCTG